jgi:hypothetical protein
MDKYIITSMIDIGNNTCALIIKNNINIELLSELNNTISSDHKFLKK